MPRARTPSRYDQIIGQISIRTSRAKMDFHRRRNLIGQLENIGDPRPRRVAMYYARLDREIHPNDILPFTSMLKGMGKSKNLDLIIHSPGGDALTADKMLDLCRKYCTGKLRVIVPLYAKSAATLMALGADEIVMGEASEIGPIDAQLYIIQDNAPQQVSADHFLRAEADITEKLGSTNPQEVHAAQIQMAGLSAAFLAKCRDLQKFSKEFGRTQLQKHMFASEYRGDPVTWKTRIDGIVDNLSASGKYLTHGRMITAEGIRADPDLKHLKVTALGESDPYWLALDDLLQRTDVVAKTENLGKILMAKGFEMVGG